MFITLMFCKATSEGDPAEWIIAYDDIEEYSYQELEESECCWFVPGTFELC